MELFNVISQVINAFTYLYLCYIFYTIFFRTKYSAVHIATYIVLSTAVCTASLVFLRGTIWNFLLIVAIGFSMTFLFNCKFKYKLVFWAIIYGIQTLCESGVGSIMSLLYGSYTAFNEGIIFVIGMMASKILILMVVFIIRTKKQKGLNIHLKGKNIGIFLFPIGTLTVYTFQALTMLDTPAPSLGIVIFTLISCFILGFSNIILFDFIDSLYKNAVNESRMGAALELIEAQRDQYQTMLEHNRDIMKIEHDNKNFCIGLISDLKEGRVDSAIDKLTEAHNISAEKQALSGDVISSIVSIKRKIALEKNVDIIYNHSHKGELFVQATDLAIVLGNALDNAIEACCKVESQEKKTVELFVTFKNGSIVMVIKNPVSSKVDVSALTSNKNNAKYHGYGIISMKQIAEKYNGEVVFSCENDLFTTSIILKNIAEMN